MYNEIPMPSEPYDPTKSLYTQLKESCGEECCEKINPILAELTPKQLRLLADYITSCAHKMTDKFEETVTMEDFEDVKKEDIDADNEEGESEEDESEEGEEY